VNKRAIVGGSVTLNCNSHLQRPAYWWYKDQLGSPEIQIVDEKVINKNIYRMTLSGNDLVIHNVFLNDTGMYTCVENTGFGEHHEIFLTVSGIYFLLQSRTVLICPERRLSSFPGYYQPYYFVVL